MPALPPPRVHRFILGARELDAHGEQPDAHGEFEYREMLSYDIMLIIARDHPRRLQYTDSSGNVQPGAAFEELRALAPPRPRYALGAEPGSARTARGWNVIVPVDVAERGFEGL